MDRKPLPRVFEAIRNWELQGRNEMVTEWGAKGAELAEHSNEIGRLLADPRYAQLESLFTRHRLDEHIPFAGFASTSPRKFLRDAKALGTVEHGIAKRISELLSNGAGHMGEMRQIAMGTTHGAQGCNQMMYAMAQSQRLLADRKVMGAFLPGEARQLAGELTGHVAQEFDKLQRLHRQVARNYDIMASPVADCIQQIKTAAASFDPSRLVPKIVTGVKPVYVPPQAAVSGRSGVPASSSVIHSAPIKMTRKEIVIGSTIAGAILAGAAYLWRQEQRPDWQARVRLPPPPQRQL